MYSMKWTILRNMMQLGKKVPGNKIPKEKPELSFRGLFFFSFYGCTQGSINCYSLFLNTCYGCICVTPENRWV